MKMGNVHAKDANFTEDQQQFPTFMNLKNVKARVDKIHIDGLRRTKDDYAKLAITDLFKAKDFQEVILRSQDAKGKLESLGCFGQVQVSIDVSKGPAATLDGVEVTFKVNEMKRMMGGISTMVGNNEGSVIVQTKVPNIFGRGEKVQIDYSHGTKNTTNINISMVKPLMNNWPSTILTGSIFSTSHEYPWSGYKQKDIGFLVDTSYTPKGSSALKHNFQYEATYRDIIASKQASFYVREQCGPNLKSALKYICSFDKRDCTIFPTAGSLLQLTTEIAGLGGDIGFTKHELMLQTNWTPYPSITLQLGLQSGLLRSISNDMKIKIADKFFLGGPLNLRGFEIRGCGPKFESDSIGGDLFWATGLHVYTPLPFTSTKTKSLGNSFRLHGFFNAGNFYDFPFKFGKNIDETIEILTKSIRCTAGAGIALKIGNIARVELNVITPLRFCKSDVLQKFQFGIGVQYL